MRRLRPPWSGSAQDSGADGSGRQGLSRRLPALGDHPIYLVQRFRLDALGKELGELLAELDRRFGEPRERDR